jgi:DNA-binding NarL/FixJ family response regulator
VRAFQVARGLPKMAREQRPHLTAMCEVAGSVCWGEWNTPVAARLFLSPRTIDYHLRKIFTKLGISSRAELIRSSVEGDGRRLVAAPEPAGA